VEAEAANLSGTGRKSPPPTGRLLKRTTLILDEHRFVELKRLAALRKQTLSSLVDEFLAAGVERARASRRPKLPRGLPTFAMGKPRVNVADRDQLEEFLSRT